MRMAKFDSTPHPRFQKTAINVIWLHARHRLFSARDAARVDWFGAVIFKLFHEATHFATQF